MSDYRDRRFALALLAVAMFLLIPFATGCGSKITKVDVTGSATSGGKAVQGGTLTFSPVAEKGANTVQATPESVSIRSDGAFEFRAAPGKYLVTYSAPVEDVPELKEGESGKEKPSTRGPIALEPKSKEVEIDSGANLTIELVPIKASN